jgi:hypothetical protein
MNRRDCAGTVRRIVIAFATVALLAVAATGVAADATSHAGEHWVSVKSPDPGDLVGIDCTSRSSCLTVGYINNGAAAVAERWNGKAWKSVTPALPSGASSALLNAVACPRATDCIAVGGYAVGADYLPLVEKWNGKSWKRIDAASVGASSSLTAVSCPSTSNCWAVGSAYDSSTEKDTPLAEHWTGTKFTTVTMVAKAQDDQINGISCRGGSCIAVGGDSKGALIERSTGKSFSVLSGGRTPKGTVGDLWAVACPSAGHCVATGESDAKKGGAIQTLSEVDTGHGFRTVRTPDPTHLKVPYNSLYGVSCVSASDCWAAGQGGAFAYAGSHPTDKDRSTAVDHWNGKRWTHAKSVNPGGKPSGFLAVACGAKASCQAVGYINGGVAAEEKSLIEQLKN